MSPATVVLLHGQPGAGSDWDQVVRQLPPDTRTVAVDRPGYRTSPHPPGDFTDNAHQVLARMDAEGIERAVLVGHSYGGAVAVTVADLAPHRVDALVLVASVGPGCLNGWDTLLAAPVAGEICALTAWWLTPWVMRGLLAGRAWRHGRGLHPNELVNVDVWARAHHVEGSMWRTFLVEQRTLHRHLDDVTAALPRLRMPVLILADPADTMVPIATAEALHAAIPGSRLRLVDHGRHHLPRRAPRAVATAIADAVGVPSR